VRRTLLALVLGAAAASIPGAAAGRGIALSASPLRLTLHGAATGAVVVRNPGRRTLLVDASRAGFARSLRGKPQVRSARGGATWLSMHPKRIRIAPGMEGILHVRSAPSSHAAAGDHPALVLLTTRPLGVRHVRVRMRVGVIVDLRVRGRIVRRLDARSLTVRRNGPRRLLELRLVNRGNVTVRLGGEALRLVLLRGRHRFRALRPARQELLPHSAGIVVFTYRGRLRGTVLARVELRPPMRGPQRSFRVEL
jgi:hypothetical protein